MKGVPFTREIAPDVLFASSSHKEAAARLEYAVQNRQFCLLTGEAGMGKSTVIRSLVHHLDPIHYHYLYICDSSLTPKLFYREVLQNFGIQPAFRSNDVKRQYQSLMLDIYENEKSKLSLFWMRLTTSLTLCCRNCASSSILGKTPCLHYP